MIRVSVLYANSQGASFDMYFDSPESFNTAFSAHAESIMADIPKFTNVQPVIELEAGV